MWYSIQKLTRIMTTTTGTATNDFAISRASLRRCDAPSDNAKCSTVFLVTKGGTITTTDRKGIGGCHPLSDRKQRDRHQGKREAQTAIVTPQTSARAIGVTLFATVYRRTPEARGGNNDITQGIRKTVENRRGDRGII
jgi:hypothetical protein